MLNLSLLLFYVVYFFDIVGRMLGLKNDTSITLSGEQIESMDAYDLESVIDDVCLFYISHSFNRILIR